MTSPARLGQPQVVAAIDRRNPTTVTVKTTHGGQEVKLSICNLRHEVLDVLLLRAEGETTVSGLEGLALLVGGSVVAVVVGAFVLDHLADGLAVVEVDLSSLKKSIRGTLKVRKVPYIFALPQKVAEGHGVSGVDLGRVGGGQLDGEAESDGSVAHFEVLKLDCSL